jgi:tetrahydromethanopterin S-methyltransferase subunit B
MNTEQEKQLRERIARMADNDLVRTMYLFEKVRELDVRVEDMMRVVWPHRPFESHPDLPGIQAMLRDELRKRVIEKSRGQS